MSPLNKLISQWTQWINRNRTFTRHEMDELENHLLEEIDDLKQFEGLSEEEAFQKVISVMGGREALDKEFVKGKPIRAKACHWIKNHQSHLIIILVFVIIFFICDFRFIESNIAVKLSKSKCFISVMNPLTHKKTNQFETKKVALGSDCSSTIYWNINRETLDLVTKEINEKNYLDQLKNIPLYSGNVELFNQKYYVVLDSQNQLWFSKSNMFDEESIVLLGGNSEFSDKNKTMNKHKMTWQPYLIDWNQHKYSGPTYERIDNIPKLVEDGLMFNSIYFFNQNTNSLNYVNISDSDKNQIIRINLKDYKSIDGLEHLPILQWEELEIDYKPIRIIPFLIQNIKKSLMKLENQS